MKTFSLIAAELSLPDTSAWWKVDPSTVTKRTTEPRGGRLGGDCEREGTRRGASLSDQSSKNFQNQECRLTEASKLLRPPFNLCSSATAAALLASFSDMNPPVAKPRPRSREGAGGGGRGWKWSGDLGGGVGGLEDGPELVGVGVGW